MESKRTGRGRRRRKVRKYLSSLNVEHISTLMNSNDRLEKLEGIGCIIDALEVHGPDVTSFDDYSFQLQYAFPPHTSDSQIMAEGAKAVGLLVSIRLQALQSDVFDRETERAMEWIQSGKDASKFAACVILEQLAKQAPFAFDEMTHAYNRARTEGQDTFYRVIFSTIYDPKTQIRDAAVNTFRACLSIGPEPREGWYAIYKLIKEGFVQRSDSKEGALLAIGEVAKYQIDSHSLNTALIRLRMEVLTRALELLSSKDKAIQKTAMSIFPELAQAVPRAYLEQNASKDKFLPAGTSVSHYTDELWRFRQELIEKRSFIIKALAKDKERCSALLVCGRLFDAMPLLLDEDTVMQTVFDHLHQTMTTGKRNREWMQAALCCLKCMVAALKNKMKEFVCSIDPPSLFEPGLSRELIDALQEIVRCIPHEPLQNFMNKKLLYKCQQGLRSFAKDPKVEVTGVLLILETLGTFEFVGMQEPSHPSLLNFAREDVLPLVTHQLAEVREAASTACARLLCPRGTTSSPGPLVATLLNSLLKICVSDGEFFIRHNLLSELDDPQLDEHLSNFSNLPYLLACLSDESSEVRRLAIGILGRIMPYQTGEIISKLRAVITELLSELRTSDLHVESTLLTLTAVIEAAPQAVSPHMDAIMQTLKPKMECTDSAVVVLSLRAFSALCKIGNAELVKYVPTFMPLILTTLRAQSSPSRRRAALSALGALVQGSGTVIDPYYEYLDLMGLLVKALKFERLSRKSEVDVVIGSATEERGAVSNEYRRDIIRVMGILGAPDPHTFQRRTATTSVDAPTSESKGLFDAFEIHDCKGSEEFYTIVVINALIRIANDPSEAVHHASVVRALHFTCHSVQGVCMAYMPQIVSALISVIRSAFREGQEWELFCTDLANIVELAGSQVSSCIKEMVELFAEIWPHPQAKANRWTHMDHFVNLVKTAAKAVGDDFRAFFPLLVPSLRQMITKDRMCIMDEDPEDHYIATKWLGLLPAFGAAMEGWLNVIVPLVAALFDDPFPEVWGKALDVLTLLTEKMSLRETAPTLVHLISRTLQKDIGFKEQCMQLLLPLMAQMGPDYVKFGFSTMIGDILFRMRIQDTDYERYLRCLLNGDSMPQFLERDADTLRKPAEQTPIQFVNQESLKKAWESTPSTAEDWSDWLKRLNRALMKESPSLALRACTRLAEVHPTLGRELFNSAFVSCWAELYGENQEELAGQLDRAMSDPSVNTREIKQVLLDLAEFMEFMNKGLLPVPEEVLSHQAYEVRSFAKALHYKEREFHVLNDSQQVLERARAASIASTAHNLQPLEPGKESKGKSLKHCIEMLIRINNELQLPEAAAGLLAFSANVLTSASPSWFEKLGKWDLALKGYAERDNGRDASFLLGRLRCMDKLGHWQEISQLLKLQWKKVGTDYPAVLSEVAKSACSASFALREWKALRVYAGHLPDGALQTCFYRALAAVHQDDFATAQRLVAQCRSLLDVQLSIVISESYERAYGQVVQVQLLSEIEEIVLYKKFPERRADIRRMWTKRLDGVKRQSTIWLQIVNLRSMVLREEEDVGSAIQLSNICLDENNLELSKTVLSRLLRPEDSIENPAAIAISNPCVLTAYLSHLWADGKRREAVSGMNEFLAQPNRTLADAENSKLRAKCFHTLGEWLRVLHDDKPGKDIHELGKIIETFLHATELDPHFYDAWHAWALMNFQVLQSLDQLEERKASRDRSPRRRAVSEGPQLTPVARNQPARSPLARVPEQSMKVVHAVNAVRGFFRCISLNPSNSLQDALRLLSVWFKHGSHAKVNDAVANGRASVSIDTWLKIIPQFIARLDITDATVQQSIQQVLLELGKQHPHAMIMPLIVASKSVGDERKRLAKELLVKMREHSPELVDAGVMVAQELVRIAVLWHEEWHAALQEASRMFYDHQDAIGMLRLLKPLHEAIGNPQTLRESAFVQAFGANLTEACEWSDRYCRTGQIRDLNAAWHHYYVVFKRLTRMLPRLTTLDLQYVSPKLLNARNLCFVVPGTYTPNTEPVFIQRFSSKLTVITSKQRPRKLTLFGEDGKEYQYLLKGHEDPRMDERVMEFFGLVNNLLASDTVTVNQRLAILRYSITPLSPNSGLFGWVQNTDTLHTLIREYRKTSNGNLHAEHTVMRKLSADIRLSNGKPCDRGYDSLSVIQKVEVFKAALSATKGDDIGQQLWLKSPDSETWLRRRTNFTRSLAVMSMVGYVLGLGDRHPSNLMLERYSGRIVHIDFGDCFEVAQHRDKYPERVPFRLTRLMIRAMEVSGIEGNYRTTCESVMRLLRNNKDSLLAVLEAFVYDPLLSWRLLKYQKMGNDAGEPSGPDSLSSSPASRADMPTLQNVANLDAQNKRAFELIKRVEQKLKGREFKQVGQRRSRKLPVADQVDRLINEAISDVNLAQGFLGWCAFW